jgi:MoaA/NifB/PqqE/SkfB family radical SAM enzyme
MPLESSAPGIVQVHPSLACNLSCRHCYSSSGPLRRGGLPVASVLGCLEDCADLGYRVLAVSGGEPFLYPDLARLLRGARSLGYRTSLTTNGTLLTRRRLEAVRDDVDVLAVSLDGPPGLHDRIRNRPGAFARLDAGLSEVRALGIPFGLVYTVGESSARHLDWAAQFAHQNDARLLQLHPLELSGRAAREMVDEYPGEETLLRTYVVAAGLRALYQDALTVQLDLFHRDALPDPRRSVGPPDDVALTGGRAPAPPVGLGVLVLEDDGTLVPAAYGVPRRFAVCDTTVERVRTAWPTFLARRWSPFLDFGYGVLRRFLMSNRAVLNWHEALATSGSALEPQALTVLPAKTRR